MLTNIIRKSTWILNSYWLFILLYPISNFNMEIPAERGSQLARTALLQKGEGCYAVEDGRHQRINPAFIDKRLRGLTPEKTKSLLKNNFRFHLKKFNNSDEYKLDLKERLNGGGPLLAGVTFIAGSLTVAAATLFITKSHADRGETTKAGLGGGAMATGGMQVVAELTQAALAAPTP